MSDYRTQQRDPDPLDWSARAGESDADTLRDEPYGEYDDEALRGYKPIHPEPTWKVVVRRLWAPLAVLAAIVWKFKAAALAIFKLKFFGAAASMLVSIAAYALIWGWWFAIGLVALLFIHEMGHVLEARRQGLKTSAPMFIPFLGALISLKQMPHDVWREARLALAGPIVGSIGAAAFWGAGEVWDSDFLRAMAFVGFFVNLFNLLPVVPLDGGRAAAALHPALWLVGLLGLAALLIVMPNPILILILLVGGLELWNRWRDRRSAEGREYYSITARQRAAVAVTYLGLAALLVVAMGATHIEREL